ncbi:DoxX family protein [Pedobacter sp. L105]|uniref:DoxX family protein n=1 Tax=Pedobacter sp. L105 TaxID=1641871 RepID=UPI00131E7EA2|nr:DoxX family protein [Pedobacter sp. L105]
MDTLSNLQWKTYEKVVFRFFFIYFLLQAVPLDWIYYAHLFHIHWTSLHYQDIFYLSRYTPQFVSGRYQPGVWGLGTLADWILIATIALAGTIVWTFRDKSRGNYIVLYQWLRIIVRYRLAIGIIGYGFIKFFPMQAPFPSISNLNTSYGNFTDWKLFSMSLGIAPNYESFLGAVEIIAGLLLLFRKTATIGALIIVVFTGNVFMSNLAYEGGEHLYSVYLVSFALFILSFDALRLYNLISLEQPTEPNKFKLELTGGQRTARLVLKSLVLLFFIGLYGFKSYSGFHHDPYQFPKTAGITKASGLYNVSEFRINQKVLPYSPTDPVRWKDVVFEKWATISVRSNRAVIIDSANYEQMLENDKDRDYESSGSSERQYYSYTADTLKHILVLENKNKHYQGEKLELNYSRPDSTTIILSGINQHRDSIYVVLNKTDKKYPILLGRRKALNL